MIERDGGVMLWSWILTTVGILGIWLAGRKSWVGWAVGLGAQVLWVAYAITTAQWGFIASAFAYGSIYARNWWKWTHPDESVRRVHRDPVADSEEW